MAGFKKLIKQKAAAATAAGTPTWLTQEYLTQWTTTFNQLYNAAVQEAVAENVEFNNSIRSIQRTN